MFDLGVSSPQLDNKDRGFSYRFNSKLDMRMDKTASLSAYEVVNNYQENDLARIIFQYGEGQRRYDRRYHLFGIRVPADTGYTVGYSAYPGGAVTVCKHHIRLDITAQPCDVLHA